jgi:hypothetical protein
MPGPEQFSITDLSREARDIVARARRELQGLKSQTENVSMRQPLQPLSHEPKVSVTETKMMPLTGADTGESVKAVPAQPQSVSGTTVKTYFIESGVLVTYDLVKTSGPDVVI